VSPALHHAPPNRTSGRSTQTAEVPQIPKPEPLDGAPPILHRPCMNRSSCPALVEPPEPGPAGRLMGPLQLLPRRPPADLRVLENDAVPRDLAHLVLRPVLPHDVDVGVRRQLLGQPAE